MFNLVSDYKPAGDQPSAIARLVGLLQDGGRDQVLLGVTGSGKTFAMASVIAALNRPALIMAPNKTLAAQLFGEFKSFFPDNAVEYFVSYYDYYQPEAYVPASDTYIEKDSKINEEIDRMRHSATRSLFERDDVVIVASVSCIFGLGSAEAYYGLVEFLSVGQTVDRDALMARLVELQYDRNDIAFERGAFRVRGDTIEIYPPYEDQKALRVVLDIDEIESLAEFDALSGRTFRTLNKLAIYPNSHYVTTPERMRRAIVSIQDELEVRLQELRATNRVLEAARLEQRTLSDIESLEQFGRVAGIENYSRHLTGRFAGEAPPTLLDYFPKDFLCFLDESHMTVPQLFGMYRGDRARKDVLVNYGFRLPSAVDNRPLRFDEFNERRGRTIYVSATPGPWETDLCVPERMAEMIVRPTGLLDPEVEIRPALNQVDDLLGEVRGEIEKGNRVLVTTLTKRMAEHLTEFLREAGIKVTYMHSDINTLDRIQIIRDLRDGTYDVLVGINLLREGLDLPEVALVAILDADKEGFLRSERSLIQTFGRAARNTEARVIMYADTMTGSMRAALDVTGERRRRQMEYNWEHGITPQSVKRRLFFVEEAQEAASVAGVKDTSGLSRLVQNPVELGKTLAKLKKQMLEASAALEFEKAAEIRDRIRAIRNVMGNL
ncbi:MAG TPA: excinuclease ABC subunit UvrB [Myxococcota bacterium]|nr:excinuclease ABC subunit UvrB [Myxococcota bacterium]